MSYDDYINFDNLPKAPDNDSRPEGIQKNGERWLCPVCRSFDNTQRHAEICNGAERTYLTTLVDGLVKKLGYVKHGNDQDEFIVPKEPGTEERKRIRMIAQGRYANKITGNHHGPLLEYDGEFPLDELVEAAPIPPDGEVAHQRAWQVFHISFDNMWKVIYE